MRYVTRALRFSRLVGFFPPQVNGNSGALMVLGKESLLRKSSATGRGGVARLSGAGVARISGRSSPPAGGAASGQQPGEVAVRIVGHGEHAMAIQVRAPCEITVGLGACLAAPRCATSNRHCKRRLRLSLTQTYPLLVGENDEVVQYGVALMTVAGAYAYAKAMEKTFQQVRRRRLALAASVEAPRLAGANTNAAVVSPRNAPTGRCLLTARHPAVAPGPNYARRRRT